MENFRFSNRKFLITFILLLIFLWFVLNSTIPTSTSAIIPSFKIAASSCPFNPRQTQLSGTYYWISSSIFANRFNESCGDNNPGGGTCKDCSSFIACEDDTWCEYDASNKGFGSCGGWAFSSGRGNNFFIQSFNAPDDPDPDDSDFDDYICKLQVYTTKFGGGSYSNEKVNVYVDNKLVGTTTDWACESSTCNDCNTYFDVFDNVIVKDEKNTIKFQFIGGSVDVWMYKFYCNRKPTSTTSTITVSTTTTTLPQGKAGLFLVPASQSYNIGDTFPVEVRLNTNGRNVVAVSAYLNFDTSKLEVVSIDSSGSAFSIKAEEVVSGSLIKIGRGQQTPGVTGSSVLITKINLRAKALGTVNVSFALISLGQGPSRVILDDGLGTDILTSVENGVYTILSTTTTTTSTTIPPACKIVSASIVPNCTTGFSDKCEAGETVSLYGSYIGNCMIADLFQIDAESSDTTCTIRYSGGDMFGISASNLIISEGNISGTWTIPTIHTDCFEKTVLAKVGTLYDVTPSGATALDNTNDAGDRISGEFTFVPSVLFCPTTCYTNEDCECTVSGCNKGTFIVTNKQGTPLNTSITESIIASPWTKKFKATSTGEVLAIAVCSSPVKYDEAKINITPKLENFNMKNITCDYYNCTIYIDNNSLNENITVFVSLIKEPEGTVYYSSTIEVKGQFIGEIKPNLTLVKPCPSGTNLIVLALAYKKSSLTERIDRLKANAFTC